jgi:SH3 domain protein
MHARAIAAALLWMTAPVGVRAGDSDTRYISDETAVTLREDKGMSAPVAALLKSGVKVQLIENDADSGYSRVKVAPGRDGWVLTRYLSTEPAARERLVAALSELTQQQSMVRKLEAENLRLRDVAKKNASPAPSVVVADPPPTVTAEAGALSESSDAVLMGTGAGLFIAGLLTGLLIPMLRRTRSPRTWGTQS